MPVQLPLSLATFDLSPERGFLPATDPLEHLPDEPIVNQIGTELPKFLAARHFRQLLDEMPKASERVMTLLHDRMKRAV